MERSRLRRLKSLFGRTNDSEQPPSPLAQDAQEPPTPAVPPVDARADTASRVSNQPMSRPQTHDEPQLCHSEQIHNPSARQTMGQLEITFFGLSDAGLKRPNNEDHFIVADLTRHEIAVENNVVVPQAIHQPIGAHGTLLAVADGLGGA